MTEKGLVSFELLINEAIAELEEFMKPKNCDGCKHHYCQGGNQMVCDECMRGDNLEDMYEPKETK